MPKILIIDDEAPVRKMLSKLLTTHNYETLEAENGKVGIKLYNEHHPDLIITDLIMPEKEGMECIRELKKINPDIKIIAISGGGVTNSDIYLKVAKKLGAIRTFSKPIRNNDLIKAIEEILS